MKNVYDNWRWDRFWGMWFSPWHGLMWGVFKIRVDGEQMWRHAGSDVVFGSWEEAVWDVEQTLAGPS